MTKRLFCFSIYSRSGHIDDYVIYYLKALVKCGDVILCADNDNYEDSLERIKQEVPKGIKAMLAFKHGEYDFGSYKYCLNKATELNIINDYDYIYICNDSVIGPITDLKPILEDLESQETEIITMYEYLRPELTGPQSWFVGFNKQAQPIIIKFLSKVTKEDHKDDVVLKYEHGLGKALRNKSIAALVSIDGLNNFYAIEEFFEQYPNYPFIKKRGLYYIHPEANVIKFINTTIKDKDLADHVISLLPEIREHEAELKPKYSGVSITRLTNKKAVIQFVIPPVDPKKKREQKYF